MECVLVDASVTLLAYLENLKYVLIVRCIVDHVLMILGFGEWIGASIANVIVGSNVV